MATLIQIRDRANAKLAVMWPVIQAKQDTYFANHGRYFGLRWSPIAEVTDGVDSEFVLNRPSRFHVDADVTWESEQVPYQLQLFRLNQDTPQETYQAFVRVQLLNGDKWERSRTRDNEDSGWYQLIETSLNIP